jgi:ubiquinone/menaquinone biosynthesis C-methylase UbiE
MSTMFANALAYEDFMGRWSVHLAPRFVEFARITDGGRVLDVGCGTGSLVRTLATVAPRSSIVGIDPAQPFIDYARTRFDDPRITFDHGSALDLPYAADSFDHTLAQLVLQFLPQHEQAASEMRRVTRPGGTVAACSWDRDGLELSSAFWEEATRLDPDAEAQSQRARYVNQAGQLTALWHASGLRDVEETVFQMRTDYSGFDDFWRPLEKGVGPQGGYVVGSPPERREALRSALRGPLLPGTVDGRFSLRAKALAVWGVVP